MKFPPYWTRTEQINKLLYDIDVFKAAYAIHPLPEQTTIELQRQTILKSSLFSARIEGNPLTVEDVESIDIADPTKRHNKEVSNIMSALEFVAKEKQAPITTQILRTIHELILSGLSADAGHLRTEESAIYNMAGIAVYLPPPPERIAELVKEWTVYCTTSSDPTPIKAGVAHIWFEKIHPFLDGNGRVGRVVTQKILSGSGYEFGGIIPLEEYFDTNRDQYYHALSHDHADVSTFVVFFLEALLSTGEKAIKTAVHPPTILYPTLLPRRRELVSLITDHKMVTFDFLSRRFRAVPSRTLHNDLQQLVKAGYIEKVGSTRGALYALRARE
jgi:Fic family protein